MRLQARVQQRKLPIDMRRSMLHLRLFLYAISLFVKTQYCAALLSQIHSWIANHNSYVTTSNHALRNSYKAYQESLLMTQTQNARPIPIMPSQLFQQLALSQLELLANSLLSVERPGRSKIKSMALYLPQENAKTGQLEFLPAILYPHPNRERVFIAGDASSGVAPTLPRTLTSLPGFAHATSLLPTYPMVSTDSEQAGVGVVEEVLCDIKTGGTALSVPLFSGSRTVGVLLVSPLVPTNKGRSSKGLKSVSVWTKEDRGQVARAAQSLSFALAMDHERFAMEMQQQATAQALSDSLHQLKNPLQALRTYGKLLQQRIAGTENSPLLLQLTENLLVQSDRLVDRIKPIDAIADKIEHRKLLLAPSVDYNATSASTLTRWQPPLLPKNKIELKGVSNPGQSDIISGKSESDLENDDVTKQQEDEYTNNMIQKRTQLHSPVLTSLELEMSFVDDDLEPIFSAFRAIAQEQKIQFEVIVSDDLPGVKVSAQALQEAVSNVIDNAFKYATIAKTKSPSRVRVRLIPNQESIPVGVTILVDDNGVGVAKEDREKVFERGFRSQRTLSVNGNGIGLDIARTLIHSMGGTIKFVDPSKYRSSLKGAVVEIVLYRSPKI